jgi:hypothetical protein
METLPIREFLVSYGSLGDFGRFRPVTPLECGRGDRAVVRSRRGLELGRVLCEATPGHARHLPNTTVGQLVRLARPDDLAAAAGLAERARQFVGEARELAQTMGMAFEVMDVELLLDEQHGVIHLLGLDGVDPRPFVSTLSRRHELHVSLLDLAGSGQEEEAETGCGREDCGKGEGGGCSSCGTGGGCSSCGSGDAGAVESHLAELRDQMEAAGRKPLL